MEFAIVLMIILIVVAIVAIKISDDQVSFPFMRRQQLFSPVERQFLELIERAVGNEFRVICRVKLIDVLSLRNNTNKKVAKSALLRAAGKQIDFVLCNKSDLTPVLAIDLINTQTKEGINKSKDFFVSGSLDTAGIPLARIRAKSGYKVEEVRDCIEAKLVPLRRRQGKLSGSPSVANDEQTIFRPKKRPTRPIRSNKPVAA